MKPDSKFVSSWFVFIILTISVLMSGCNELLLKEDLAVESATQLNSDKSTTINVQGLVKEFPVILFQMGSSSLSSKARKQLREIALLINHPELVKQRVSIDGHSDTLGDARRNLRISKLRAEAVRRELAVNGVRNNRLITNALGERQPLMSEFTPDGQLDQEAARMNRRVEIFLVGSVGEH